MPTPDEGAKPANILPNPAPAGRPQLPPPVKPARSVRQTIEALEAIENLGEPARAESSKSGAAFRTGLADSRPAKSAGAGKFMVDTKAEANPNRSNWLKYAAAAVLALGLGWGASAFVVNSQGPNVADNHAAARTQPSPQLSPMDLLRQDVARMNTEITALRTRINAASPTGTITSQAAELRTLRQNIAALTTRIEAVHAGQAKANAEMGGRMERVRVDDSKLHAGLAERISRLEKRASDSTPVGSISSTSVPKTSVPKAVAGNSANAPANLPQLPAKQAAAEAPQRVRMPQHGYVLREVYRGMALVEGRNGYREILPGDYLPGAGRIRSIERRSGKWVVVTSNGTIDTTPY